MEKRYQVFVSSTYADLVEERAAVVAMLLDLDALPAGMELFPATNDDAWTLIQGVIDGSDYYLLVIGGRYGSVDDETDLSYTEKEFEYAVAQGKPVMAFLHGDTGKIPLEKTDRNDAARDQLDAFRAKVEKQVHVKYWTLPSELAGQVASSFTKLQKSHPAVGWIRGDVQTSTEAIQELNALRKQLQSAEKQLTAAREAPPPGSERFAQGSETVTLGGTVHAEITSDNFPKQYTNPTCRAEGTWDSLFAYVGPSMMDEAEHEALRDSVGNWFATQAYDEAAAKVEAEIELDKGDSDPYDNPRFRIILGKVWHQDFETVVIQLRALGLIAKSERKRGVNDTATYWTLTPYGDTHLTTLRAILQGRDIEDESEQTATDN